MLERQLREGPVFRGSLLGSLAVLCLLLAGSVAATDAALENSGLKVAKKSVLFGNARRTTSPAVVDCHKALAATAEAKKIKAEGIRKGSARYSILISKAQKRLKKVIKKVAVAKHRDCVIKKGRILANPDRLDVKDLTKDVIKELEDSEDAGSEDAG
ncbi:MAG: hypothetical protein ACE5F1_16890 [Planctomycetota bacterium]